ncbi:MAG: RNA polymerase factor sigma-54 [Leptospiraceae bacterium]|nr:RNA polymerase factor sigma-54 [Leptospiraceae bacterium]
MPAPKNTLRTSQKLGLSLGLRASLKILSMGQLELRQHVQSILEENPFVDEATGEVGADDFDSSGKSDFIEELAVSLPSLPDHLHRQFHDMNLSAAALKLAETFISYVDANGFTSIKHEEIIARSNLERNAYAELLHAIRDLEPTGLLAETSWQCLEWQAEKNFKHDPLLKDILSVLELAANNLARLSFQDKKNLAESLHVEFSDLQKSFANLYQLDPFPGRNYTLQSQNAIYPEVVYQENGDSIDIIVHNHLIPELHLNRELYEEYKGKGDKNWEDRYAEAENLIRSIQYRQDSLIKIARSLLVHQYDFFKTGTSAIKPLNLADIASEVKLHISTVSRIVSQKHCQCRWGVFPLKIFFPMRLKSNDGSNLGSEDLRQAILELVGQENSEKPYSDSELTTLLREKGFDVQRRTVAKYRNLLHIAAMADRKKTPKSK